MMTESNSIKCTIDIVAAFVSFNSVPASDLPDLIATVHAAFSAAISGERGDKAVVEAPVPVVPIRKSVTPDYLVCLDDGKRYKSLRRHLALLGMTPEQYRAKWGLPFDYPMVASNYSAKRSEMAKNLGLGRKREERGAPAGIVGKRRVGRPRKKTA